MHDLSVWLAFYVAGLFSFVSPCTLPLLPSYLGYISGVSSGPLQNEPDVAQWMRTRAFFHALCFALGLSVLFVILGWGASAIGVVLQEYKHTVRVIGGALVIVMGLFMAGAIKSGWLMQERRLRLPTQKPLGYLGSFLVGLSFAAGWTPCVGPMLASVLTFIANRQGAGTWYMVAYALGFTVPFLVLAVTLVSVRPLLKYTEAIARIGGWLLVVMGVLLLTNKMVWITIWIQSVTGYRAY